MEDDLRRLRGLVGVGTTWGLAWGVIGALIGLVIGVVSPELVGPAAVEWGLGMGAYGLVSGLGFGGLLAYHERRKTVDQLSPTRAAILGVLGAVVVPILFGMLGFFELGTTAADVLEAMAATAVLGGAFAGGSVALARSAPRVDAGGDRTLGIDDEVAALEPARTEEPALRAARSRETQRR
jgi:hypothetical protein